MIRIPKIIHVIWIGPRPFPYSTNLNSYKELNEDWVIKLWTNEKVKRMINKKSFNSVNDYACKADILRLEILYKYGGIYVDADSMCLKPLNSLVDNLTCFGMTGNGGNVANGFLGCTKGNKTFKKLVYKLEFHLIRLSNSKKNKSKGINIFKIAGTRYITPILRKDKEFIQIDRGKRKGTREKIGCRFDKNILETGYVYHKNSGSWRKKNKKIKIKKLK